MGLAAFENKLEQMISGVFARAFRSAVQPVEIAAALQREVDNNAQILSRDRRLVPNDFAVELSPADLERLTDYDATMASELSRQLHEHADGQSYVFPGPVTISFEAAEDLTTGRFRVRSRAQARVSEGNYAEALNQATARPGRAVLEVNGTTHHLYPPGLVVGRGEEADIRINDPGISRKHIEIMVPIDLLSRPTAASGSVGQAIDHNAIIIKDLGSTNGILVDGQKVTTAAAADGTWIKIGNTTLTIRVLQDSAPPGDSGHV
ncbi:MAG: FhaA domain-containing protein [Nocardioides sp.]